MTATYTAELYGAGDPAEAPALRRLEVPAARGAYIAELVGRDPKYRYTREWRGSTERHPMTNRRVRVYHPTDPGLFEVRRGRGLPSEFYVYDGETLAEVAVPPNPFALEDGIDFGPGGWFASRCWCEAPVDHYTADGLARCAEHSAGATETQTETAEVVATPELAAVPSPEPAEDPEPWTEERLAAAVATAREVMDTLF